MSTVRSADTMPRGPILAIAALLLAAIVAAGMARQSDAGARVADAPAVVARSLLFSDRPDGGVDVTDAVTGRAVAEIQGEAGFLRGALRALTRERRMRSIGPQAPFELVARADGRLTLADPATGRRIDLESFGPANAGVFSRLLDLESGAAASR
jgi:putative photosynthetic complex assembly protein